MLFKISISLSLILFLFSCKKKITTVQDVAPIIWKNDIGYTSIQENTISSISTVKAPNENTIRKKPSIKTLKIPKKLPMKFLKTFKTVSPKTIKPDFTIDEFLYPDKWYLPILIVLIYMSLAVFYYQLYWIVFFLNSPSFWLVFFVNLTVLGLLYLGYYFDSVLDWFETTIDWFKNGCKIDWSKHPFISFPTNNFPWQ